MASSETRKPKACNPLPDTTRAASRSNGHRTTLCKQAQCALLFFAVLFVSMQIWLPAAATFVLGIWADEVAVGLLECVSSSAAGGRTGCRRGGGGRSAGLQ